MAEEIVYTITLRDGTEHTGVQGWKHQLNTEAACRNLGIDIQKQNMTGMTVLAWSVVTDNGQAVPEGFPGLDQAISRLDDNPIADISREERETGAEATEDYVPGLGKDMPTAPSTGGAV